MVPLAPAALFLLAARGAAAAPTKRDAASLTATELLQPYHYNASKLEPLPKPSERKSWPAAGNKTIWLFWSQGEANLELKRYEIPASTTDSAFGNSTYGKYRTGYRCLQGWRRLNPGWDVRLLDEESAQALSPMYATLKVKGVGGVALWSDVLRLDLLARYGGVWADISTCPVHPLDAWLPNYVTQTGFFTFWWKYDPIVLERELACEGATTDRRDGALGHPWGAADSRMVVTWFMAAPRHNHSLVRKWRDATYNYVTALAPEQKYPYFVCFCELTLLMFSDPEIKSALTGMPRVSGHPILGDPFCCPRREHEVDPAMLMYKSPMAGANISDATYESWITSQEAQRRLDEAASYPSARLQAPQLMQAPLRIDDASSGQQAYEAWVSGQAKTVADDEARTRGLPPVGTQIGLAEIVPPVRNALVAATRAGASLPHTLPALTAPVDVPRTIVVAAADAPASRAQQHGSAVSSADQQPISQSAALSQSAANQQPISSAVSSADQQPRAPTAVSTTEGAIWSLPTASARSGSGAPSVALPSVALIAASNSSQPLSQPLNCDGWEALASALACMYVLLAAVATLLLLRRASFGAAAAAAAGAASGAAATDKGGAAATADATGGGAASPARSRDPLLDNAKFALMVLVIFNHWLTYMKNYEDGSWRHGLLSPGSLQKTIWQVTWFHMPLFAIISGYVTRPLTAARFIVVLTSVVAPLVLHELIQRPLTECFLSTLLMGNHPASVHACGDSGWQPQMWRRPLEFLALILWRLILSPALSALPKWVRPVVAIGLGLAGAYAPTNNSLLLGACGASSHDNHLERMGFFSFVRAATLSPFFFFGQAVPLERLATATPQMVGGFASGWAVLLLILGATIAAPQSIGVAFAAVNDPYRPFGSYRTVLVGGGCMAPPSQIWLLYLGELGLRLLMSLAFLLFAVPRSTPAWIARNVDKTLFAYLLQASLLSVIGPPLGRLLTPWPWATDTAPVTALETQGLWITAALLLACSFITAVLLTSSAAVTLFGWALTPRWLTRVGEGARRSLKARAPPREI